MQSAVRQCRSILPPTRKRHKNLAGDIVLREAASAHLTMFSWHPRASVTFGGQPGAQSVGSHLSHRRSFARNFARTTASITERREKFCPCDNDVTAWQSVHCDTLRPRQRASPITFRTLDLRASLRNHESILANHHSSGRLTSYDPHTTICALPVRVIWKLMSLLWFYSLLAG